MIDKNTGLAVAPKTPSAKSVPVSTVEAWLNRFPHKRAENKPNGGVIRSVANTYSFRHLPPVEHKAAVSKAQKEFKEAKLNLSKQEMLDAAAIKKQQAIWRKEEMAAAKEKAAQLLAKKAQRAAKRATKKALAVKSG